MKKLIILTLCFISILFAVSCSNKTPKHTYTVTLHDGTVFKGVRDIDTFHGTLKGFLPSGIKIYASGNWYLVEDE